MAEKLNFDQNMQIAYFAGNQLFVQKYFKTAQKLIPNIKKVNCPIGTKIDPLIEDNYILISN